MPHYKTEDLCNIALVGQSGAGKTTLAESLLYHAKAIPSQGKVENGNTVCDCDPMEKSYIHSLTATVASFDLKDKHINLIDTPGLPDFLGHSLSVFHAVETIAVVINAQTGIDIIARRMLEKAEKRNLCRLIIINKIDAQETDLVKLVASIKEAFGPECLPINLPAQRGTQVVDCFFNPSGEADFSSVAEAHTQIIDQVVEVDEKLMELYLEQGQSLNPEQLHAPFEQALREGHLIPICFVSARTGAGVPELLDILTKLMPNPLEGNPRPFFKGEGRTDAPFLVKPDASKHVVAHVFKVMADPFVGKVGIFRIHQGTISNNSQLFIGDGRKPFKVSHLFKLQGKQQIEVEQGIVGDICALAKVDALQFDAVLHDSHDEDFIHIEPLIFPEPMYNLAVEVKKQGDEQKVNATLQKIADEDPCLRVEHHAALNETVLRGLGELHLRVALERMAKQYNVEVNTRPPKIPYRETIGIAAEGHHRHKKQSGGAGQFGEVFLRIEPLPRGSGFEFSDDVVGGAIPGQFIPAVEKGVRYILETGAIAGYPLQDIRVSVYDGKYHTVDSKEIAFVTAAKKAFIEAINKAKPLILEPIMKIEVTVPEEAMGTVTGDLSVKRGKILGSDIQVAKMVSISAEVPLSELSNYQMQLKSVTGGHGFYTMEFSHYEAVPTQIQHQLVTSYKPTETDE
jgi:elongation factor G